MHELSIAQALMEQVKEVARKEHARTVKKIFLVNTPLSGVDSYALKQAFPIAAQSTVAAGAELIIDDDKTKAFCRKCKTNFLPEAPFCICTNCNSTDINMRAEKDLVLKSVELDIE